MVNLSIPNVNIKKWSYMFLWSYSISSIFHIDRSFGSICRLESVQKMSETDSDGSFATTAEQAPFNSQLYLDKYPEKNILLCVSREAALLCPPEGRRTP